MQVWGGGTGTVFSHAGSGGQGLCSAMQVVGEGGAGTVFSHAGSGGQGLCSAMQVVGGGGGRDCVQPCR